MADLRYTPLIEDLPHVYRRDDASFEQLTGYLGIVDDVQRAYLDRLDELAAWLSPQALDTWPAGVPLDGGRDPVLAAYRGVFDELAAWFGYVFPSSWPDDTAGLDKKRRFLLRAARLWRLRGTPRGFVDWVAFAFDIVDAHRPMLLEHFKYGLSPMPDDPTPWLRATLIVRSSDPITNPAPSGQDPAVTNSSEQFQHFARRRELVEFVESMAPSHVIVRVCWVDLSYSLPPLPTAPLTPAKVAAFDAAMRTELCTLVDTVPHALAADALECANDGTPKDRLGVARLPSVGRTITHPNHP